MSQHSIAYQAAREGAAVLDRTDRGRIVVSGADRRSYLQGLLTNDIEALAAGQGCYAAYLTAQGRMIADVWVYEVGDVVLLSMIGDVTGTVLAKLDQFIFSEDVQLGDVTQTFAQIAVLGPRSAALVAGAFADVSADALSSLPLHGNLRALRAGSPVIVTRVDDAGESGFDIYLDRAHAPGLLADLRAAGVPQLDEESSEALRIEAGVPRFHRDMDEETIPLEAGIESRAISFTKGCYVGQEVIIRVLHRGHGRVARKLVGLRIAGPTTPSRGATIRVADRAVGEVTSAAFSPALNQAVALGYVHRDFVEPGTAVTIDVAAAQSTPHPPVGMPATVAPRA